MHFLRQVYGKQMIMYSFDNVRKDENLTMEEK